MALRIWFVIALVLPALIALQIIVSLIPPTLHCPARFRPGTITTMHGEVYACINQLDEDRYLPNTAVPPFWKRLMNSTVLNPFIYGLFALNIIIAIIIYTPISIFWAFIGFPLATVRAYYSAIAAWDEFVARRRVVGDRLFPGKAASTQDYLSELNNLGSATFLPETAAAALRDWNCQHGQGAVAALGFFGTEPLAWQTDKHVLILASSRSGKGVSLIIPNLLTYPGGVFVLDPKGENARATLRQRRAFGPVAVLDPWNIARLPAAHATDRRGFNPLAALLDDPDRMPTAAALAGALVIGQDDHWNNAARLLLRGILLHVLTAPLYEGRRAASSNNAATASPARRT